MASETETPTATETPTETEVGAGTETAAGTRVGAGIDWLHLVLSCDHTHTSKTRALCFGRHSHLSAFGWSSRGRGS